MSKERAQGQHSRRGQALLLDLRDQALSLFKDANVDAEKASQISNELMYIICQHWGGQLLYITKGDGFFADERDIQIYKDFNGHNQADLAQKYDLSVVYIYRIVKRMAAIEKARLQPDLFGG
ncbi:Mor transcription activator family protein [Acinetobacter ursingii]|uniref:Mor transcription activator family protein n=1 Tax=Acinetobacter ursingii TaxID=108980 RepID=UPI00300880EB